MRQAVRIRKQVQARVIAHQEITQRLRCTHHVDDATAKSLISAKTSPKATIASFDDAQELTKGQVGVGCGAKLVGDSCEYLVVIERRESPASPAVLGPSPARRNRLERDRLQRMSDDRSWSLTLGVRVALELRQVAVQFPGRHLLSVLLPLRALVAQEEVEDVLTEGFGDQFGFLHRRDGLIQ